MKHLSVSRYCRGVVAFVCVSSICAAGCSREAREHHEADPATVRRISSGELVGFTGSYGEHAWLGIPYAKPPTANLRWRAPQPPQPWDARRNALAFGSPCTQFASSMGGVSGADGTPVGNEDCLFLNVYAPKFQADQVPRGDARLPVMLWIHGGGNSIGEAGFYNGGNLATTENVIVVTINYRLGPFGWFRHAALRSQNDNDFDRSGNYGTLDLIRALEWIRENASVFGGNPDNVTIFGESAGGTNVFTMLLSPPAKGLFHRAIVQSGGLMFDDPSAGEGVAPESTSPARQTSDEALVRLLLRDGRAKDRAGATETARNLSAVEVASYLRGKSAGEILTAYEPFPGNGMIEMPKVFRDGVVLPIEDPIERLGTPGGYNDVPVIFGTNRDENKLFMLGDPTLVRRYLWIFLRFVDEHAHQLTAEYLARMWKATGVDEPAAAIRRAAGADVFAYRFDWDEEPSILGADLSKFLGAAHGFEIPFVFGHFDLGREGNMIFTSENEHGRKTLSRAMMAYWAEFARHGRPGRGLDGTSAEWTAWDASRPAAPKYILFDTPAGGGLRMAAETYTRESVVTAIPADTRFTDQRERCRVLHALAKWSRGVSRAEYDARADCREYPFEKFPW